MKRSDLILLLLVCGVALLFGLVEPLQTAYMKANAAHPYVMAFLKFAILATLGEVIGLGLKRVPIMNWDLAFCLGRSCGDFWECGSQSP